MQVLGTGLQAQAYMSSAPELYTWSYWELGSKHPFIFPTWEEDDRKRARKTASLQTERNREGLRVPAG